MTNQSRAVRTAITHCRDAKQAAEDIFNGLGRPADGLTVFFCSPYYDLAALGDGLRACFADAGVIGCTTAGEIASIGYLENTVVAVWFPGEGFQCVTEHVEHLQLGSMSDVNAMVRVLKRRHAAISEQDDGRTFAICLIDGITGFEELVLGALREGLGAISLVGGSAGDAMRFRETAVYHAGSFHTASVVLALIRTPRPFQVFATQHFTSSQAKMVVTQADPQRRAVIEINAEPAAQEYARIIGMRRRDLGEAVFATHPLAIKVGNSYFVRSIQRIDDDGALKFYCAVDEGIVLTAAGPVDMVDGLDQLFAQIRTRIGQPDVVLAFDCLFRKIEARQRGLDSHMERLFGPNRVVGFSTYGEQFNALHLNQTFTGIAIGRETA
ncbi:MAG TPA: nitric oxide-sensing protein NosP [Candidatus Aquilonibacter sp.]